jgi:radical SAM superfamily enzyme
MDRQISPIPSTMLGMGSLSHQGCHFCREDGSGETNITEELRNIDVNCRSRQVGWF